MLADKDGADFPKVDLRNRTKFVKSEMKLDILNIVQVLRNISKTVDVSRKLHGK